MSFPLSVKHPILQPDFLKSENKDSCKLKRAAGAILIPNLPQSHHHPDQIGHSRLKLKKPSIEQLFKDKSSSPEQILYKNEKNFYMSRKQAADFFTTNELLQKMRRKLNDRSTQHHLNSQQDSSSHFVTNETNNYSVSHGMSEEMRLQKQLLDEMAKGSKTDRSPRIHGDGDSPLAKLSKIHKSHRKFEPIILPKLGFMSTFALSSSRELQPSHTSDHIKEDEMSPKMSLRTYEFIALQKRKLLGNDYSRLQKIQRLLEHQKQETTENQKPKPKADNITLALFSEPSEWSEQHQNLEGNKTEKKRKIQSEVNLINKGLFSLNYDSLRDEYNPDETSIQKEMSTLNLQTIENKSLARPHKTENEYGISPSNRRRSEFEKYIRSLNFNAGERSKSLASYNHDFANDFEIAKIQERQKQKANEEYSLLTSSVRRNNSEKKLSDIAVSKEVTTELKELTQQMSLAKKGNHKLKKQFRKNKKALSKNFNSLDKKIDKVNLLLC